MSDASLMGLAAIGMVVLYVYIMVLLHNHSKSFTKKGKKRAKK